MTEDELKVAFRKLRPTGKKRPSRFTWDAHCYSLHKHVRRDNIDEFLNWSTINATMFAGDVPFIQAEFSEILYSFWREFIEEPGIGNPPRLPYYTATSGNLVHQAYHLLTWTQVTGLDISELDTVVEFGGGYGALALVAHRLGFRGKYTIIDLPEFSLLQQYYLSSVLPKHTFERFEWVDSAPDCDLLIGCYSLSEVPIGVRIEPLTGHFGSCLIAYQDRHNDVNNLAWFQDYADRYPERRWHFIDKDFHPGHHYLIGEKRNV
jgi:hypothetical protein